MKENTFDIETYPNYTLFAFRNIKNAKLHTFEIRGSDNTLTPKQIKKMKKLLTTTTIVTFNGIKFDEPITVYALKPRVTAYKIFQAVQAIIVEKMPKFAFYRKINANPMITNHIDIMDVLRGQASLKLYGARFNAQKLQDLPYEVGSILSEDEMDNVRDYCENDLKLTQLCYEKLHSDLQLREDLSNKYGLNLMSLNGAKIAVNVLVKECGYEGKAPSIPSTISYTPPKYIKFKTPQLKEFFKYIKNHTYLLTDSGNVELPAKLRMEKVVIDGIEHKMGNGGLHGSVERTTIKPKKDEVIIDIDYARLYPSLMINNDFVPHHIDGFMEVYKTLVESRDQMKIDLKKLKYGTKDYSDLNTTQNGIKLISNSSFGQLGLRFSKIYDPSALLHITITGQLTLLMVIEKLHLQGFKTFYANTDGITLCVKKKDEAKVRAITKKFDDETGLMMEYNTFKSCHIRDVNNFINITTDGEVKSKGVYGDIGEEKNPQTPIVYDAVKEYLRTGKSIKKTIKACKDVAKFCSAKTVRGGAMFGVDIPTLVPDRWDESFERNKRVTKSILKEQDSLVADWVKDNGTYLGKVVRWYYSTKGSSIHYKTNGNKVGKTDGAYPMMDLKKKIPKDLDYDWYYNEAVEALADLGVEL